MKILLDTNIIILRENNHVVPPNLINLMSLLNGLELCSLHVHQLSKTEILNDLNQKRREINFAKNIKLRYFNGLSGLPEGFRILKQNRDSQKQERYC